MIAYNSDQAEAPPAPSATTGTLLSQLWAARGFFGGLASIGLALLGQFAQVRDQDQDTAGRYYIASIALLLLTLTYPGARRRAEQTPSGIEAASPLRARPARSHAAASATTSTAAAVGPARTYGARLMSPWHFLAAVRERLGWRLTAAGAAITVVLAGACALSLFADIASPLGGWLWVASLAALLLTAASARPSSHGGGLLPGPRSDLFGRGIPAISPRLETALVVGILVVALAARLYNLEYHPGIFGDEGERGLDARAINAGGRDNIFGYGWWNVPNLYFYCVAAMLRIFGDNMVGDRMLSVVSGAAVLLFAYKTGRLLWGPRVGILAMGLLAASPLALQFSRHASESSPTGALWAGGFYFLFAALRSRRPLDWALCGALWSFGMYFYASGKLIVPVAALVVVYCLVRWRLAFFKRYGAGAGVAALAFALVFLPNAILNVSDNWTRFSWRSQETAIFAPGRQAEAFARYSIPYDPSWAAQPLLSNILSHPGSWAQLIANQARVTTEVLYRTGDGTVYFQVREHNGSMLPPLLAAIALLGLAYGLWRLPDARFGILSIWFWGGMFGIMLTMETPSVQRMAGAWPAIMLFPAALLDRVFAASWPISLNLARRWATIPLAALVIFLGADGLREYFVHYTSLCPYCKATTQARYAQALGDQYKAYVLGKGEDVFFGYGSTAFAAKGVEGQDVPVPVDVLPVTNNGEKGAAFMVYSTSNSAYLPLLRAFYPDGKEEPVVGGDGTLYFTSYKLTHEQIAAYRVSRATYTSSDGREVQREEPGLGTRPGWNPPPGLSYPARAQWRTGLYVPQFGLYRLDVRASEADLTEWSIDGRAITFAAGNGQAQVALAKGLHTVVVSGTLSGPSARLEPGWSSGGSQRSPIAPLYLFKGQVGGLLAEAAPAAPAAFQDAADPFGGTAISQRRMYSTIGFRESAETLGTSPFTVRFRGTLHIRSAGRYTFETNTDGPCLLYIDDIVITNLPGGEGPAVGTVNLAAGQHRFEMRHIWDGGVSPIELFWTPPGGGSALVPSTAFSPAPGVWVRGEIPDPPGAPDALIATEDPPQLITPDAQFGAIDLSDPKGIAVDSSGNVYVGDRGHSRVVVFAPDGRISRQWGKPLSDGGGGQPAPGEFPGISDLAVGADGTVYVLDGAGRVQIFDSQGNFKRAISGQELGMYNPNGIDVGPDGTLYVADTGRNRVLAIRAAGSAPTEYTGAGGAAPALEQPLDVAAGRRDLYAIDLHNRIVQVSPGGQIMAQWELPVSAEGGGGRMAVAADGRVIVSDAGRARVAVLDIESGTPTYFGGKGTRPGQFVGPSAVAAGPDGRVYVLDRANGIQIFRLQPPK